jgi:hypothetical protein
MFWHDGWSREALRSAGSGSSISEISRGRGTVGHHRHANHVKSRSLPLSMRFSLMDVYPCIVFHVLLAAADFYFISILCLFKGLLYLHFADSSKPSIDEDYLGTLRYSYVV